MVLIFWGAFSRVTALGKLFYVLFVLANLITVPLFSLALIQWYKKGDLKGAFAFKQVWGIFAKDVQSYLVATLVLAILPLLVSLVLEYSGYGIFRLRSPVLFFPGAFIQLILGCLWFWLAIVGARIFGQIYSSAQK